jgi:hypothetical protein
MPTATLKGKASYTFYGQTGKKYRLKKDVPCVIADATDLDILYRNLNKSEFEVSGQNTSKKTNLYNGINPLSVKMLKPKKDNPVKPKPGVSYDGESIEDHVRFSRNKASGMSIKESENILRSLEDEDMKEFNYQDDLEDDILDIDPELMPKKKLKVKQT